MGMRDRLRGKAAGVTSTILIVAAVTIVLLVITAQKADEFWRLAVPTYLTGVGTLALAVLNVVLLRQEAADRQALATAQEQRDRDDAMREARKVITTSALGENSPPYGREVMRVLNAGSEPILNIWLIRAAT